MIRTRTLLAAATALTATWTLFSSTAYAETFEVGTGKPYASIGQVAGLVGPGDIVEVQGDATYAGGVVFGASGTPAQPITIRGIRVNGKRPILQGGAVNTVEFAADHYVFEGFEVTGGATRCVFHHGHDLTVRDALVRDCPGHGILGADSDSGSLTLEYVEVRGCGQGDTRHPIYIATDEEAHPGSVFRMQHCFVHQGNGGNNVKSRAERNEIFYNWIEGATYHELELIGPDGADPSLAREDSDVVGNVFRKTNPTFVVRVGGDGTGDTSGRYRFLNNTFLLMQGSSAAIRAFDGVESIEASDNVFYRVGGGAVQVINDSAASWVSGALVSGFNNWMPSGSTGLVGSWAGTVTGADPGFVDAAGLDFRPAAGGALVDAGMDAPPGVPNHPFPSPLGAPGFEPPMGAVDAVGTAETRSVSGSRDIGAFEHTGLVMPGSSSSSVASSSASSGGGSDSGATTTASGGAGDGSGGAGAGDGSGGGGGAGAGDASGGAGAGDGAGGAGAGDGAGGAGDGSGAGNASTGSGSGEINGTGGVTSSTGSGSSAAGGDEFLGDDEGTTGGGPSGDGPNDATDGGANDDGAVAGSVGCGAAGQAPLGGGAAFVALGLAVAAAARRRRVARA